VGHAIDGHARDRAIDIERMLHDAGLRVTRQRRAVYGAVSAQPHSDTDSVITAARAELPELSHQAVYDALGALTQAGLVRRIQPQGSLARYEARIGDNHHHAVCRQCGAVADVDCAVGAAPCLEPSDAHGFLVETAEVVYWGLCADCSAA
jgi:Fur family ferric uptake transcriptional regulator